jgi:hypothetical protein
VFKHGWLPDEAVLGSIVPILRSRKAIAKRIQGSSSMNAKKSLNEKKVLMDRLSSLVTDKISKFRSPVSSSAEVALEALSQIFDEMKQSLNKEHCSCCSLALITAVRCIPDAESSEKVKEVYTDAINDWSNRKTSKIHVCVLDDLVQRLPSLSSLILIEPLMASASSANSPYLKCESMRLLSSIYKRDKASTPEQLSGRAQQTMTKSCANFAETLRTALDDSSLSKAQHRDKILEATKQFIGYLKAHDEGLMVESDLSALADTLNKVGENSKSAGMKQVCSRLRDTISGLPRKEKDQVDELKPKRAKTPKTPKTNKKAEEIEEVDK